MLYLSRRLVPGHGCVGRRGAAGGGGVPVSEARVFGSSVGKGGLPLLD